ncbi:MAG: LytTR family transcriptional regulator [Proteobacteria bacterium]|nr:LytTR family transcriptional regulator [Pseudomonadota bacterium]
MTAWTQEVLRIGGASLLGAAVTPLLLGLTRRLPIEGPAWRNRALVHAASIVGLSVALIVVAQVLAAVLLAGRAPRLQGSLGEELARNGALLVLCMAAFTAIAHAVRFLRRAELERERSAAATERAAVGPVTRVPVKTRGGVLLLRLDEVDWIETQGNYLALHAGPKVHLIRQTLARFEGRLDPQQFVRIHRRTIVRADRVRELTHMSNGDASVRLADGAELRLSRSYSSRAQAILATRAAPGQPASG